MSVFLAVLVALGCWGRVESASVGEGVHLPDATHVVSSTLAKLKPEREYSFAPPKAPVQIPAVEKIIIIQFALQLDSTGVRQLSAGDLLLRLKEYDSLGRYNPFDLIRDVRSSSHIGNDQLSILEVGRSLAIIFYRHAITKVQTATAVSDGKFGANSIKIGSKLPFSGTLGDDVAFFSGSKRDPNQEDADGAKNHADYGRPSGYHSPQRGSLLSGKVLLVALIAALFVCGFARAVCLVERGCYGAAYPYIIGSVSGLFGTIMLGLPFIFGLL